MLKLFDICPKSYYETTGWLFQITLHMKHHFYELIRNIPLILVSSSSSSIASATWCTRIIKFSKLKFIMIIIEEYKSEDILIKNDNAEKGVIKDIRTFKWKVNVLQDPCL